MEEMSSVVERGSGSDATHARYCRTPECAESLRHQSERLWWSALSGMAHEQVSWRSAVGRSRILRRRSHCRATRARLFEPGCCVVCGERSRALCPTEVWERNHFRLSREYTM